MHQDLQAVLLTEEEIRSRVSELGKRISRDYEGKNLLMVSILKGSVVFMSDLMRALHIPVQIDFMAVSSYAQKAKTSGVVRIVKDLDQSLENFDLLLVEDILDSGLTLSYIRRLLEDRHPKSVRICTLLDKPEKRKADVRLDYCGFNIPDAFVVGYGLDYGERYRNLPYVGILDPKIYQE